MANLQQKVSKMSTPELTAANLLIEIGTEELPPKALKHLGESFAQNIFTALSENNFLADENTQANHRADPFKWFATPRRLAVRVQNVKHKQADQTVERRGPAVKAAFDADGNPTKAALGFASSVNANIEDIGRLKTDKGEWLAFNLELAGQTLDKVLAEFIDESLKKLPIPKRMRWGDSDVEFVRPVHWSVVLHGNKTIKLNVLGIATGNLTQGHRFHCDSPLILTHADEYETSLAKQGHVVADFDQRREQITDQLAKLEAETNGHIVVGEALLNEVTALVESPHALLGDFDQAFLDVPKEALVSSMRDHQKYFHVVDDEDELKPHFVTISNIKSKSPARVKRGNERVLRARLADALFFWNTDRVEKLSAKTPGLKQLLFHKKLGSVFDKTQRLTSLATAIARRLKIDEDLSKRAATLCKTDLITDMVGEFPELQGVMGRYYATHDGEDEIVANAIEQHYRPRFAGDKLPDNEVAKVLALAEKIDTLVGIFLAGEQPSGDKDPYALRRTALGVLRICIEDKLNLELKELFEHAAGEYQNQSVDVRLADVQKALAFTMERLHAYYADTFTADEIASVSSLDLSNPLDFANRLHAVKVFQELPEALSLAAAYKRIGNILKQAEITEVGDIQENLLIKESERALAKALTATELSVAPLIESADYEESLKQMASLQQPVDAFFDQVMVMDEDSKIRANRLALLSHINQLFFSVANIGRLKTGPGSSG